MNQQTQTFEQQLESAIATQLILITKIQAEVPDKPELASVVNTLTAGLSEMRSTLRDYQLQPRSAPKQGVVQISEKSLETIFIELKERVDRLVAMGG